MGNEEKLEVRFLGVDRPSQRCTLEIVGKEGWEIKGRITDPALAMPGNPYTQSLDRQVPAFITAKPVYRDGEMKTLYISDGRLSSPF